MTIEGDFAEWRINQKQLAKRLRNQQRRARRAFDQRRQTAEVRIRHDVRGWLSDNETKAGRLNRGASLRTIDAKVARHMDDLLQDVTGSTTWPPERGGRPETITGVASTAADTVDTAREAMEMDGPTADEFLKSKSAERLWEDHRMNPVGVRERETRQVREGLRRWTAEGVNTATASKSIETWAINKNVWNLSTDAHSLAYARNYLGKITDANPGSRLLVAVDDVTAQALDPTGRTAQIAFRTFKPQGLDDYYASLNEASRSGYMSWRTLTGHNTSETYVPIPPKFLALARPHYAEVRRRFLAEKRPTLASPSTARELEASVAQFSEDFRFQLAGTSLTVEEQRALLQRVAALEAAVRAGTILD